MGEKHDTPPENERLELEPKEKNPGGKEDMLIFGLGIWKRGTWETTRNSPWN